MRLKDKVIIITGSSSGIGMGIAEVFAREGASVVCASRDIVSGNKVVDRLKTLGLQAMYVQCDVSSEGQVKNLVQETLNTHGRIDALVNNAGVNFVIPFEEMEIDQWDRVLSVDLRGTFLCIHACIKQFLNQGAGSVLNIASVHTKAALPCSAAYDAAKYGMVGMTKSLAVEYASKNIRFNCLSPGLIDTKIWQDIQNTAEDKQACLKHWEENIPIGRVGTIEEMGRIAAFLVSDDASYITGENIIADGGMSSQLVSKVSY